MKKILFIVVVLIVMFIFVWVEGDVKVGKKVFKKCKVCYSFKSGDNKVGLMFYNIIGVWVGMNFDFCYLKVMKDVEFVWDVEIFVVFLIKFKDVVLCIFMVFNGLKKFE